MNSELIERLSEIANRDSAKTVTVRAEDLRAILALSAGDPVAVLYADGSILTKAECGNSFAICCKVETPLFTHTDTAEVNRLRAWLECSQGDMRTADRMIERLRALVATIEGAARELLNELDSRACDNEPTPGREMEALRAVLSVDADICEPCEGTGYARANGLPLAGTCDVCQGAGQVNEGKGD